MYIFSFYYVSWNWDVFCVLSVNKLMKSYSLLLFFETFAVFHQFVSVTTQQAVFDRGTTVDQLHIVFSFMEATKNVS